MFCPNCEAEYVEGFTVCADCECDLVASLDEVAVAAPAGPDRLEPFHQTSHPEELGELLEALERAHVPYVVHAGTALALWDGGALRAAATPDAWEARIAVLGSALAAAREVRGATPREPARPTLLQAVKRVEPR